ncbi:MAG: hypothetical protein FWH06_00795 [Oscillospiraceae bacterium]|nr:hypothetical protein [Oscillospiraceae bacterium]
MDSITSVKNYALLTSEGIIENIIVAEPGEPIIADLNAIEVPDMPDGGGYMIGDAYIDGQFVRMSNAPPPADLRRQAYETLPIIPWADDLITVDAANGLWVSYAAEDSPVAETLTALIIEAKQKIRDMYTD